MPNFVPNLVNAVVFALLGIIVFTVAFVVMVLPRLESGGVDVRQDDHMDGRTFRKRFALIDRLRLQYTSM